LHSCITFSVGFQLTREQREFIFIQQKNNRNVPPQAAASFARGVKPALWQPIKKLPAFIQLDNCRNRASFITGLCSVNWV
jgi:hypothetical protein